MTLKPEAQPKPRTAKVEYLASKELIENRLKAGYTVRMIYEELTEGGKLSISYSAFCDYVRGGGVRQHGRKKKLR